MEEGRRQAARRNAGLYGSAKKPNGAGTVLLSQMLSPDGKHWIDREYGRPGRQRQFGRCYWPDGKHWTDWEYGRPRRQRQFGRCYWPDGEHWTDWEIRASTAATAVQARRETLDRPGARSLDRVRQNSIMRRRSTFTMPSGRMLSFWVSRQAGAS